MAHALGVHQPTGPVDRAGGAVPPHGVRLSRAGRSAGSRTRPRTLAEELAILRTEVEDASDGTGSARGRAEPQRGHRRPCAARPAPPSQPVLQAQDGPLDQEVAGGGEATDRPRTTPNISGKATRNRAPRPAQEDRRPRPGATGRPVGHHPQGRHGLALQRPADGPARAAARRRRAAARRRRTGRTGPPGRGPAPGRVVLEGPDATRPMCATAHSMRQGQRPAAPRAWRVPQPARLAAGGAPANCSARPAACPGRRGRDTTGATRA